MSVRQILKNKPSGVVSVGPWSSTTTAARRIIEHGVGGLPVVDSQGALLGFISERDLVRAMDGEPREVAELSVSSLMRRPAPVCAIDDSIRDVMTRMTKERLRHLVVLDQGAIAGVISVGDIVKQRLEQLEMEAGVLRDYVAGQRARR